MRVKLKGINRVRKKLADGRVKDFYYAWKSGPALRGAPGSPEFIASYNEAVSRKVVPPRGMLLSLLQTYQASPEFEDLASSTRRSYIALIKRIEREFSDFPLAALTDRRTRGVFKVWRDRIAAASGRRQADYAWTVLARILAWGLDRGLVAANPCERGGRLYRASRNDKIWTPDDEARFLNSAPRHLHLPLLLGVWTGHILVNSEGKPWTADGFRASWRKACAAAAISGVTFHDLRGTAVTRLGLVGATEAEIATVTGLSLKSVREILDAHYLSRDPALAESAILKLERGTKMPN
jgi:integrase